MKEHDILNHPSPERLLNSLQSKYWVVKGMAIKRYLHKCFICYRYRAMPSRIKMDIEWNFSPPSASYCGGNWDILVKSAKVALESIVKT